MFTPGMNDKSVSRGMELRLDLAIQGVESAFPPGITSVSLRGVTYTQADLEKKLDEIAKPWKDARAAHEFLRQFAQDKDDHYQLGQEFLGDLRAALAAHLGRDSEQLTRFGFVPMKRRRQLTVEEKLQKAAKAKLTRQLRGTLGRRQREAIQATETPSLSVSPDGTLEIHESNPNQPNQPQH